MAGNLWLTQQLVASRRQERERAALAHRAALGAAPLSPSRRRGPITRHVGGLLVDVGSRLAGAEGPASAVRAHSAPRHLPV